MKIIVGTTNKAKIEAVKEAIQSYDFLNAASIESKKTESQVSDQPKTIDETVEGAINRAKGAYEKDSLAIGIESGLMKIPYTKSGYMNVSICAIYDGTHIALGFSPAFEYPKEIMRMVLEKNITSTEAANITGLTNDPELGSNEGILGILTKGRITRKDYTVYAIRMALIQLENKNLY